MPLIADWQAIAHTYEHHVNEILRRADRKQRQYDYPPGQQVLKKVHAPTKLGVRTEGPYTIERDHVNGNLTILLHEGITPYYCVKGLLNASTYAEFCRILNHSTHPCEDNS